MSNKEVRGLSTVGFVGLFMSAFISLSVGTPLFGILYWDGHTGKIILAGVMLFAAFLGIIAAFCPPQQQQQQ